MARNTLSRSLHDLGLAAWFGGTLANAVALNPAAAQSDTDTGPGAVANTGWDRWNPVNAAPSPLIRPAVSDSYAATPGGSSARREWARWCWSRQASPSPLSEPPPTAGRSAAGSRTHASTEDEVALPAARHGSIFDFGRVAR